MNEQVLNDQKNVMKFKSFILSKAWFGFHRCSVAKVKVG